MTDHEAGLSPQELLAAAYALDGPDANRALYARWAATYESGFVADSGYSYPGRVAAVLAEAFVPRTRAAEAIDGPVLDVGCGTGLGGSALRVALGAVAAGLRIDGLDLSAEMLREAAAKRHESTPVYTALIEADLTATLPIATGTYAAAVSAGTFTHGHVGPEAIAEVLRIVRPGGVVVIGVNAAHYAAQRFGDTFDAHERAGRITAVSHTIVPIYDDADPDDPDRWSDVVTCRVG